tara:strand:- start:3831 stop:3989 length:159 start_codon:yes stop_codon:yes gene_type:complete
MGKEEEIKKIEKYLQKLEVELVMSEYSNGWLIKWVEDKMLELEDRLKQLKND